MKHVYCHRTVSYPLVHPLSVMFVYRGHICWITWKVIRCKKILVLPLVIRLWKTSVPQVVIGLSEILVQFMYAFKVLLKRNCLHFCMFLYFAHCIYSAIQLSSCKCVLNKVSCQLSSSLLCCCIFLQFLLVLFSESLRFFYELLCNIAQSITK